MKKSLIMSLVVAGMIGLMLTGCGNKPEKVTVEMEPTTKVTTEVTNPEEQPLINDEPTAEPADSTTETATNDTVEVEIIEDGTVVSDEQVEVGDYLSEHGIIVTPCGEMKMTMARMNSDEVVDTTVVTAIEVVPSSEEGYSDTIFTAKVDVAATNNNFNSAWHVYDRYTGYDLEGLAEQVVLVAESGSSTNTAVVEIDGKEYDCIVAFDADIDSDPNYLYLTITVHHPVEYDGVVFEAGKLTATMQSVETTVDKSVVRKIADYPELIEGHYFFTASNN